MGAKQLTTLQAVELVAGLDPLLELRIAFGWKATDGHRLPTLKLSAKSVTDYRQKAKPLGTIVGSPFSTHPSMLVGFAIALDRAQNPADYQDAPASEPASKAERRTRCSAAITTANNMVFHCGFDNGHKGMHGVHGRYW